MSKLPQSKLFRRPGAMRHIMTQAFIFFVLTVGTFFLAYFVIPPLFTGSFSRENAISAVSTVTTPVPVEKKVVAAHLPTPLPVKAIYMTSCVVGTPSFRTSLVKFIEETEINSVVIDIKDFSGTLSFISQDPVLKAALSTHCYAPDIKDFIALLHEKKIYVIGRITVFQDPYLVKMRPELAVKRKSDGGVWKDRKGLNFTDPGSREVWDYIISIAKESYAIGFDELNFDYIRFPSDGNMTDIAFPWSGTRPKSEVLKEFFAYLHDNLKPTGAVLSADLFGMTTTNTDDLNIGQVLEKALPYFDYIAPMVYPSHYPPHFMGFANPADKPYEVVKFSMDAAVRRTIATTTTVALFGAAPIASTTPKLYPKESFSAQKIRPWLQDFNLGAIYTAAMVDKQIQAVYDSGLTGWMLWNAGNHYTKEALKPDEALPVPAQ